MLLPCGQDAMHWFLSVCGLRKCVRRNEKWNVWLWRGIWWWSGMTIIIIRVYRHSTSCALNLPYLAFWFPFEHCIISCAFLFLLTGFCKFQFILLVWKCVLPRISLGAPPLRSLKISAYNANGELCFCYLCLFIIFWQVQYTFHVLVYHFSLFELFIQRKSVCTAGFIPWGCFNLWFSSLGNGWIVNISHYGACARVKQHISWASP